VRDHARSPTTPPAQGQLSRSFATWGIRSWHPPCCLHRPRPPPDSPCGSSTAVVDLELVFLPSRSWPIFPADSTCLRSNGAQSYSASAPSLKCARPACAQSVLMLQQPVHRRVQSFHPPLRPRTLQQCRRLPPARGGQLRVRASTARPPSRTLDRARDWLASDQRLKPSAAWRRAPPARARGAWSAQFKTLPNRHECFPRNARRITSISGSGRWRGCEVSFLTRDLR